jgi:hypothetical protein
MVAFNFVKELLRRAGEENDNFIKFKEDIGYIGDWLYEGAID